MVQPRQLVFRDFVKGDELLERVTLRNASDAVQKVRIVPPATRPFRITVSPPPTLAPGQQCDVLIAYTCTELREASDRVTVLVESGERVPVLLHAMLREPPSVLTRALHTSSEMSLARSLAPRVPETSTRVFPAEARFPDIAVGQPYEVTVSVQNMSTRSLKMRVRQPTLRQFRVVALPRSVAAGLAVPVRVQFECSEEKDYHDSFAVIMEDEMNGQPSVIEVPIHATLAAPHIEFDSFVSYGVVTVGGTQTQQVVLRNEGTSPGEFSIVFDDTLPLRIFPVHGVVQPGSKVPVSIEFTAHDLGVFRALAQVDLFGQHQRIIDINATVVDQAVQLMQPDQPEPALMIRFPAVYHGQQLEQTAILANPSPRNVSFVAKVTVQQEKTPTPDAALGTMDDSSSSTTDMSALRKPRATAMHVFPQHGMLDGFGQVPLTFRFTPELVHEVRRDESEAAQHDEATPMKYTCTISIVETGQDIEVPMIGNAVKPAIFVSRTNFDFGDVPMNERLDIMFTLKNTSSRLPIDYQLSRIAHFKINKPSGQLQPLQARQLIASFVPNQLGTFSARMDLELGQGIFIQPLMFRGSSSTAATKSRVLGGIQHVADDFKPQFRYLNPDERPKRPPVSTFQRRSIEDDLLTESAPDLPKHALTRDEFAKMRSNRQQYSDYLRKMRAHREAVVQEAENRRNDPRRFENAVDIGIEPGSGMVAPEPELPSALEPLYLQQPYSGGDDQHEPEEALLQRKRSLRAQFDENVLFKRKFKAKPVSAAELRDCVQALSSQQLLAITSGPKRFEFGQVSIRSVNAKSLFVSNDTDQNILVALEGAEEELAASMPEAQVIPPHASAGFDIVFSSPTPQAFQRSMSYLINGLHRYQFNVAAEAVPITLDVAERTLHFRFTDEATTPFLTKGLMLHNPGNATASFEWETEKKAFSVSQTQGSLEPGKSMEVKVTYYPEAQPLSEETLTLKIDGGPPLPIKCIGEIREARCIFGTKKLEFGMVPVGVFREKQVVLKNVGKYDAFWEADKPLGGLTIQPSSGHIAAGASQSLVVTLKPTMPQSYDTNLIVNVRGGKQIKLSVRGDAEIPSVEVAQDEFDFGGVYVGGQARKPLTLSNTGSIAAVLLLDLVDCPDFALDLEGFDADESPIQPIRSKDEVTEPKKKNVAPRPGTAGSRGRNADESMDDDNLPKRLFKISINAGEVVKTALIFRPSAVVDHGFELPLSMAGLPSTPSIRRVVAATGLKPPLLISESEIDFGHKVVLGQRSRRPPYMKFVRLTNDHDQDIDWRLAVDTEQLRKSPFHFEPSSGSLPPGATCDVKISFAPREPVLFAGQVDSFIHLSPQTYISLSLRGIGCFPMLTFDPPQVVLPMVPLGLRSEVIFNVVNNGYETMQLRFKAPPDSVRVPLEIEMVDGDVISLARPHLRVRVAFKADKPMSFASNLDFFDVEGNKFSVNVAGATDNSLLSLFPFLLENGEQVQWQREIGKPIVVRLKDTQDDEANTKKAMAAIFGSTLDDSQQMDVSDPLEPQSIDMLRRWINSNAALEPMNNLPGDFVKANGAPIYEIIMHLSGKMPPGRVKLKSLGSKSERVTLLVKQYEDLLTFLKQHGAFVNTVKAEHLLSLEDAQRAESMRIAKLPDALQPTPVQRQSQKQELDESHGYVSLMAWTTILYQVVKVFVLSRITTKQVRTMPMVEMDFNSFIDAHIGSSNVYSVAEIVLLRWMSYMFEQVTGTAKTFYDFAEFRDSYVFGALLAAHVPKAEKRFKEMRAKCAQPADMKHNAIKLIAAMKENGFDYVPQPEDLMSPNSRDLLLFSLYLYQTLPLYVPKAEIEFSGALHTDIVKSIDLANGSKRPISYRVILEGDDGFSVRNDFIEIPAKESVSVEVVYRPKFTREANARLTFAPHGEGAGHGSIMVFQLQSGKLKSAPIASHTIDGVLYQPLETRITITNPFDRDAAFEISLIGDQQCKEAAAKGEGPDRIQFLTEAFFTKATTVSLKANASTELPIQFVPIMLQPVTNTLRLNDAKTGEFLLELKGTVQPPRPLDRITMSASRGELGLRDFAVPFKNPQIERCKQVFVERMLAKRKVTAKTRDLAIRLLERTAALRFQVEVTSPSFKGPKTVGVAPVVGTARDQAVSVRTAASNAGAAGAAAAAAASAAAAPPPPSGRNTPSTGRARSTSPSQADLTGTVSIEFRPDEPGTYHGDLILASDDDIRVYPLEGTCALSGVLATLEFDTHARETIVQDIPVFNTSQNAWSLRAELSGQYFSGPDRLAVPAGQSAAYRITFNPLWMCEVSGKLTLVNTGTNDSYEYELKGAADEPLAVEKKQVQGHTRQPVTLTFNVPNILPKGQCQYSIETDLPNAKGPSDFVVKEKSSATYELTVVPHRGGPHLGSVSFVAPNEQYVWFIVEVLAEPPPPEGVITASTAVRKACVIDIELENPTSRLIEFEVEVDGEGLMGDPVFEVPPNGSSSYEVLYTPLAEGKSHGRVVFFHEQLGEFWYELKLEGLPTRPSQLPTMYCAVGQSTSTKITLENPLPTEVTLRSRNSNSTNFKVTPAQVTIPPYTSMEVTVEYTPSSLNEEEAAVVTFSHAKTGDFIFEMRGIGKAPDVMPAVVVASGLHQSTTGVVTFRNPFPRPISLQLSLRPAVGAERSIALMRQQPSLTLQQFGIVQIPFTFMPSEMRDYAAELVLFMGDLQWVFPIKGIAETAPANRTFTLQTKARQRLTQTLSIRPPGLQRIAGERFSVELEIPEAVGTQLQRCLSVVLENARPKTDEPLNVTVQFEPLKPVHAAVDLILVKESGGRWLYELDLEASAAETDDVIVIEAELNRTESVQFRLCNQFNTYAPFHAAFTPDSPDEFVVFPETGVLEPASSNGTMFVVSFTPTRYGRTIIGKLLIQTDDMQWTYEVRGTHPFYEPPVGVGKVQNKLAPSEQRELDRAAEQRRRKNFIKDNVEHTRKLTRQVAAAKAAAPAPAGSGTASAAAAAGAAPRATTAGSAPAAQRRLSTSRSGTGSAPPLARANSMAARR